MEPATAFRQPPSRAEQQAGVPHAGRWLTLAILCIGAFVAVMDVFLANVAAPAIGADLQASAAEVQLVVASYGLSYAATLITGGRLGDLYGRRRMFAIGMVAFVVTSVAGAVAPSAPVLIGWRVAQGIAAGLMFPQVLSSIQVLFDGRERRQAMGRFGAALGLASTLGQLLGGVLLEADLFGWGWRTLFLAKLPLCALALALLPRVVETRSTRGQRVDLLGVVLVSIGLVLLVFPLVVGRQAGWPAWSFACLAAAALVLAAFAAWQWRLGRRGGDPLVDLRLFGERAFSAGLGVALAFFGSQVSFFFVLTVSLQSGLGASPLAAGLTFAPTGIAFLLASLAAVPLTERHGRRSLAAGAAIMAVSFAGMWVEATALGGRLGPWDLVPWLALNGAGAGLMVTPLMGGVLARVPRPQMGAASGLLTTGQQVANASGIALIGLVFYGLLGSGGADAYAHAFAGSMLYLIALMAVSIALTFLLPGRAAAPGTIGRGR